MKHCELIKRLTHQSTWRLCGLAIITLGISLGYYLRRQTRAMNEFSGRDPKISEGPITIILLLLYASAGLQVLGYFSNTSRQWEGLVSFIHVIAGMLIILWGFMASKRLNQACNFSKQDSESLKSVWTLFLTPIYFNYKVNTLSNLPAKAPSLEGNLSNVS